MLALFSFTALASAYLLFWIEPLFAKLVLPLLGGSPAVWNTCLMFFQATLLLGYLYAHLTSRFLGARKQAWIHVVLLFLALLTLPVGIPRGWSAPPTGNVIPWMLALLIAGIGAPFLLLAATAPLVQRWLAASNHKSAKNPYVLYAASNAGSLLGLLSFPFVMEPIVRLSEQTALWGVGYVFVFLLMIPCALLVSLRVRKQVQADPAETVIASAVDTPHDAPAPVTMIDRAKWLALAFIPSSLLLGVTTYLTTDVAAVPLLWVVPLSMYLLTFIIAFARSSRKPSWTFSILHAVLLAILGAVLMGTLGLNLGSRYNLHVATFGATALLLHSELARSRPSPEHLTEFYLWMALGGALGGAFNAIFAPLLFNSIAEYQIALVVACLLRPDVRGGIAKYVERIPPIVAVVPAIIVAVAAWDTVSGESLFGVSAKSILFAIAGVALVAMSPSRLRFAIAVLAIVITRPFTVESRSTYMFADRSFFGAYRVHRVGEVTRLVHGTTTHGAQFIDPERRLLPMTYYHFRSPVGQLFSGIQDQLPNRRIGVVGLGAGTLLCYSRPGEEWTFFEIDPLVLTIARNDKYFTYFNECAVRPQVVIGDARLTLRQQPAGTFGLLMIDAFNSDAIPVHLLTREAFAVYKHVLHERGILFVHISNKHLRLQPVVARLAADAGMTAVVGDHDPTNLEQVRDLDYPSEWVALARYEEDLGPLLTDPRWKRLTPEPEIGLWTDDYSDLFSVLRW